MPLGELRTRGVTRHHVAFAPPWGAAAGLRAHRGRRGPGSLAATSFRRTPRGDLLQAGPLLVRDGEPCFERALDPEGFSAGRAQFDSDITDGRHPRAALGIAPGRLVAVVCDGRSKDEPG